MKWSLLFRKGIMELEFKSILQTSLLIIIIIIIIITMIIIIWKFSSRNSTRWLFFPPFPLEFRIFVLVEGRKPEAGEKPSQQRQEPTSTQPTHQI